MNYYDYLNYLSECGASFRTPKTHKYFVIVIDEVDYSWSIKFDKRTLKEVK